MAERANAQSGTGQTGPTTLDNPAPTDKPGGSTQEKKSKIPTAADFHPTPNQPYVAATDSGYKVYANQNFTTKSQAGGGYGGSHSGLKLVGPDGKTLGYHSDQFKGGWIHPGGIGYADDLKGLKPDPAWSGETQTTVAQPGMPGSEVFDKPPNS